MTQQEDNWRKLFYKLGGRFALRSSQIFGILFVITNFSNLFVQETNRYKDSFDFAANVTTTLFAISILYTVFAGAYASTKTGFYPKRPVGIDSDGT